MRRSFAPPPPPDPHPFPLPKIHLTLTTRLTAFQFRYPVSVGLNQSLAVGPQRFFFPAGDIPLHNNNRGLSRGDNLPYYTMDLHTAGNHCDHRLSVTDGVCQHCTCSLCFHLAIKPVGSCCHRDQFTIWMIVVCPCVCVDCVCVCVCV